MNCWLLRFSCLGLVLLAGSLLVTSAYASTSGEDEAWDSFNQGRFPLAMSGDGRWLVYEDAEHVLHRQATENPSLQWSLRLPRHAVDIAVSRDGKIVMWTSGAGWCVGVVHFADEGDDPNHSTPTPEWIEPATLGSAGTRRCGPEIATEDYGPGAGPLAISADGALVAVATTSDGFVDLIDLATRKRVRRIPTGEAMAVELRFVDADRKLMVKQALLGQGSEGPDKPSAMQFAVWDLTSGELQRWTSTVPATYLSEIDFTSSYSDVTGEMLSLVTAADSSGDPAQRTLRNINLKECRANWQTLTTSAEYLGTAIASDPLGRWYALLDVRWKTNEFVGSSLSFRSRSGESHESIRLPLQRRLSDLAVSSDGTTVFATTRADYIPHDSHEPNPYAGGELQRFAVPKELLSSHKKGKSSWSKGHCPIDDETLDARAIDDRPVLTPLTFLAGVVDEMPWGIDSHGQLWLDRSDRLQRIDAISGGVAEEIKYPEASAVAVLYERNSFLIIDGNNILLQPWGDPLHKRVLASLPGWKPVHLRSLYAGGWVEWVQEASLTDAHPTLGSGVGILYDLDTGNELLSLQGTVNGNEVAFEFYGDEPEGWYDGPSTPSSGALTAERYHWQLDLLGSVRAQQMYTTDGSPSTVLWSGLALTQDGSNASVDDPVVQVMPLEGALAAAIRSRWIDIYQADSHRLFARIDLSGAGLRSAPRVGYLARDRTLVIEYTQWVPDDNPCYSATGRPTRVIAMAKLPTLQPRQAQ